MATKDPLMNPLKLLFPFTFDHDNWMKKQCPELTNAALNPTYLHQAILNYMEFIELVNYNRSLCGCSTCKSYHPGDKRTHSAEDPLMKTMWTTQPVPFNPPPHCKECQRVIHSSDDLYEAYIISTYHDPRSWFICHSCGETKRTHST